jgi:hypothetical protein
MHHKLNEGLEQGDLKRLLHPELHIDEFKSKLGRDEDVIVISFKVKDKEPAKDLMNFCEKGYTWVLDADVSSGELDDGDYVVFVETERNDQFPDNLIAMLKDIMNLSEQDLSDWVFRYHKGKQDFEITAENLVSLVPLSTEAYEKKFGNKEIDKLKAAAGVKVNTKAPKNDHTESIRRAAGII